MPSTSAAAHSERRLKKLPTEAAPPQSTAKDVSQLGTVDEGALAIQQKAICSAEELARKTDKAMARREASGIADRMWSGCSHPNPHHATKSWWAKEKMFA